MNDSDVPAIQKGSSGSKIRRFSQWVVFVALLLFALIGLIPLEHRGVPGFPETFFWISLVVGFALALIHFPSVFFRLDRWPRMSAYAAILPSMLFTMMVVGLVAESYEKTPSGKIELYNPQDVEPLIRYMPPYGDNAPFWLIIGNDIRILDSSFCELDFTDPELMTLRIHPEDANM